VFAAFRTFLSHQVQLQAASQPYWQDALQLRHLLTSSSQSFVATEAERLR
jgi:hypothetical protein